MFATDIGMNHVEEVNIIRNGENYGWMKREGYWENGMIRPGGALNQLYPLPAAVLSGKEKEPEGFTYPVAIYDHTEGAAITGGFTYNGRIAALRGKFVFGDINRGRLFAADVAALKKADDGVPQTVAPIEEIQLYVRDARGNRDYVSFRDLVERVMGASRHPRRPAVQPHRRRRAAAHVTAGRDDPDARARRLVGHAVASTGPASAGPGRLKAALRLHGYVYTAAPARSCASASGSTGLVRCASNPTSNARCLSWACPHPVTATRTTCRAAGI